MSEARGPSEQRARTWAQNEAKEQDQVGSVATLEAADLSGGTQPNAAAAAPERPGTAAAPERPGTANMPKGAGKISGSETNGAILRASNFSNSTAGRSRGASVADSSGGNGSSRRSPGSSGGSQGAWRQRLLPLLGGVVVIGLCQVTRRRRRQRRIANGDAGRRRTPLPLRQAP